MALQESGEMYLETIYVLSKSKGYVRAIDVSETMGYSKPSVSRALGILKADNYLVVESDGNIVLTDSGKKIAQTIYERHIILTKLLVSWGVDQEIAQRDACKIEHVISDETIDAIKKSGFTA